MNRIKRSWSVDKEKASKMESSYQATAKDENIYRLRKNCKYIYCSKITYGDSEILKPQSEDLTLPKILQCSDFGLSDCNLGAGGNERTDGQSKLQHSLSLETSYSAHTANSAEVRRVVCRKRRSRKSMGHKQQLHLPANQRITSSWQTLFCNQGTRCQSASSHLE